MLCCFPRPRGPSLRTPHGKATWERGRGWFTRPRFFSTHTRNCPTVMGSTGQGSAAPAPRRPETRGSAGQVSLGSATSHSEPLSLGQAHLGLATTTGNRSTKSLTEVYIESSVQAGPLRILMEPLEPAFLDSGPSPGPSFLHSSRADKSTPQALLVGSSTSPVHDSALELQSWVDLQAELLLEPPEPLEAEPPASAPAHAEFPAAELVPAPPAAPSPAQALEPAPAPGSSWLPAAEPELLLAPPQGSPFELYLEAALDPNLPFPSLPDLLVIVLIAFLNSQRCGNGRINVNKVKDFSAV
ncbi:PREDICTED: ral guanine nucleotide dissociation stimulator-like [Chinchilla lanigera]|uniref:ral guanine nucleotide dissociation stimulator-like n=1 Tax=Chinchilla lanigera TaxID=34839 RepID=UPI00038EC13E|nr:PREDICTED: ral guanine nucleotide dissociation stimulator-like [Chinchilla lanigera]